MAIDQITNEEFTDAEVSFEHQEYERETIDGKNTRYFFAAANAKNPQPNPKFPIYRTGKNAANALKEIRGNDQDALAFVEELRNIADRVQLYKDTGKKGEKPEAIGKPINLESRQEQLEDKLYF